MGEAIEALTEMDKIRALSANERKKYFRETAFIRAGFATLIFEPIVFLATAVAGEPERILQAVNNQDYLQAALRCAVVGLIPSLFVTGFTYLTMKADSSNMSFVYGDDNKFIKDGHPELTPEYKNFVKDLEKR